MMKNMYHYKNLLQRQAACSLSRAWVLAVFLAAATLLQSFSVYAQTTPAAAMRPVSGRVTGATDNDGLPGVSVVVKGTARGISTDINGNYTLEAAPTETLVFSYIGFASQEILVGDRTTINVSLRQGARGLDEVVIVGYGEQRRGDLTSAQTTVTAEAIERTVNTTIEQAIQGRAAGVYVTQNTGQPGGGISVNIRGVNSITGSNEPLYVIDGVQIQPALPSFGATSSTNPLAGINPADIESMEILQGPSATAIYGSRGTNGVVLITTKRGKAGEMRVNYGFLYTLQDRPTPLKTMNLQQYAQMTNEIRELTGGTPPAEFGDPSILGPGTDWQEELFMRAPLKRHQLSLSGGSEATRFYMSGEFFDQAGVALGSHFNRYSIRLNVDNQTRKWLKLGTTIAVNQTDEAVSATQENVIVNALSMAPHIAVRTPSGDWGGADETNNASVQHTPINPIAIAQLTQNDLRRRGAIGGFNAEIGLLKGLIFRTTLNGSVGFSNGITFMPTWQIGARTNNVASLSRNSSNNWNWNWNQLMQYTNTIGKHYFSVMASHEAQESGWENISGSRQGFVSNDLRELTLGNPQGQLNGSGRGHWAMESYLGRVNYTFNDKYIIQGAFRADGSANFGPENRWGFFPSVSAAWRVTGEPFMQTVPVINDLKIRVETGLTGNQGGGAGIFAPIGAITNPWGSGFLATRSGNPGLQWEETRTNNVGLNLAMFQNRIQFEADFYIKNTDNLLMNNPLPWYMGTSAEGSIAPTIVNIGALENRGYAISLNTVNIDNGDFSWTSTFNVSGFRAKITQLYSDAAFLQRTSWWMNDWTQHSLVGQAPWLFYGYVQEGIFQSREEIEASAIPVGSTGQRLPVNETNGIWVGDIKYRDINGDGIINQNDQTYIGNPWPKATFGMTQTLTWKGFELMALVTGSYGNDVYNYVRFANTNPNNINLGRNMLADTYNYARIGNEGGEPVLLNPGHNVPRLSASNPNGNFQRHVSAYVEDGSYLRVKKL
ncbi:TonB-dependent receptor [soil metagenome]